MRTRAVLIVAALAVAGCGGGENEPRSAARSVPERAQIDPNKDPHAITCADLSDKEASATVSRRAQVALAADARVKNMSPLRVGQSIFFAMTELCKGADESYTPATDAVRAVRQGKYIADLGAP